MKVLFTLLETSIYSAIILLIIIIFKKAFQKKLSATIQFALWSLFILRLLLPFSIDSGINLIVYPSSESVKQITQSNLLDVPDESYTKKANYDSTFLSTTAYNESESSSEETESDFSNPQLVFSEQQDGNGSKFETCYIFIVVWLLGFLICFAHMVITYIQLKKKLYNCTTQMIPKNIKWLVINCANKMNIKKICGIRISHCSDSIFLFASVKPKLIISENMLRGTSLKSLEHCLLHEFAHLKRKDSLLCLLTTFLCCVYWFNPFVWWGIKLMKQDMETACDAMATRTMTISEKIDYSQTLISLFSHQKQFFAVMGMAVSNTKKNAEKRIRGVFMKKKINWGTKLIVIMLITIIFCTCFTTACQPTPEEEVVVGKNDGNMESAIEEGISNDETKSIDVPETYSNKLIKNNVIVSIDATVETVKTDRIPVWEATYKEFTQEDVDKMAQVLVPKDAKLYDPITQGETMTQSQIMDEIVNIREQISNIQQMDQNTFDNIFDEGDTKESIIAQYNKQIDELEVSYNDAPTEESYEEATTELKETENGKNMYVMIDAGRNYDPMQFMVYKSNVIYARDIIDYVRTTYVKKDSDTMETTLAEAENEAVSFLHELGINDMVLVNSGLSEEIYSSEGDIEAYYIEFAREVEEGYLISSFEAAQPRDTAIISDTFDATEEVSDLDYSESIYREMLFVIVNDLGVINFSLNYARDNFEKVSNNVELLSFDKILEIAENNMFYKTYVEQEYSLEINVDKIVLSYMYVAKQNDNYVMRVIPVWDFIGTQTYTDTVGNSHEDNIRNSYLTINAIDGSIIDRQAGY